MTTTTNPPLTLCELADPGVPGLESYSPFCVKVHRALRVAGLPYTRRHGAHPGVFKRYNPAGKVPVLLIGDEPVCDSTEILRRIEAMVPGSLVSGDSAAQAEAWLWEEFADASLSGFVVAARWADERNWPAARQTFFGGMPAPLRAVLPGIVRRRLLGALVAREVWSGGAERCWARFEALLDRLEARAPRDGFWIGGGLSVADLAIFAHLHNLRADLTPWQQGAIRRRAALSAYLDRVNARTSGDAAAPAARAA
ncbi:glutathione S-transferase family protein [Sorangium sp. So ce131]|uniref:glutathione S-transferase family protein n=1 Tax=Sorangium sp. So ce131 TaxID=3133282 RepID=UPI003F5F5CEA